MTSCSRTFLFRSIQVFCFSWAEMLKCLGISEVFSSQNFWFQNLPFWKKGKKCYYHFKEDDSSSMPKSWIFLRSVFLVFFQVCTSNNFSKLTQNYCMNRVPFSFRSSDSTVYSGNKEGLWTILHWWRDSHLSIVIAEKRCCFSVLIVLPIANTLMKGCLFFVWEKQKMSE